MTKEEKQEVIETLKGKFSQYTNFYITDTENLSVAQVTNLRRHCFNKQVEMKVAKNTLIKKALESLDNEKYSGVYDSLHKVTALMFSESPKDPAVIISSFRREIKGEKPVLKAAFLNGDIFLGDNQLIALTKIKTKNEMIGEVISLLLSPIQRVLGALQNRPEVTADVVDTPAVKETPAAKDTRAAKDTPVVAAVKDTPAAKETPIAKDTPAAKETAGAKDTTPVKETPPVKDTPPVAAVKDTPPEAVVKDTPTEAVVKDTPTEAVVKDTPAEAAVKDTSAEAAVKDTPPEDIVKDIPAES